MPYKYLHIVCLDAPAPPDYGGAIDMFYKIEALSRCGIKITLHYFNYRKHSLKELEPLCYKIFDYNRMKGLNAFSFLNPYIVQSRINNSLIKRLNEDNHPVLLEGIHCSGILPYLQKKNRSIVIRVHNNEAIYYKRLAKYEKNIFKKLFFNRESKLLERYQKNLPNNIIYACLSTIDVDFFKNVLQNKGVHFVASFSAWQNLNIKTGKGDYCLYHGNMSVSENEEAAIWLIDNVFKITDKPFVIAGKNISVRLKIKAEEKRIKCYNNPNISELNELIRNAQINVIHSVNSTGVKLKLLHALFEGRHCIANKAGAEGSGINTGLHIANNSKEYKALINELFQKGFTKEDMEQRKPLLHLYNNESNAQKLIALLYSHYP